MGEDHDPCAALEQQAHGIGAARDARRPGIAAIDQRDVEVGAQQHGLAGEVGSKRVRQKAGNARHAVLRRLRSTSCRISGVKMSCIARSSLLPGTTIELARDMKASWIIDSR